jgi:FixJ family two-component response regulator
LARDSVFGGDDDMASLVSSLNRIETNVQTDEDFGVVLIVDDDVDWVDECAYMLETMGYKTARAYNVAQAFDQVVNQNVSTVLVDYRMPDGDGISLIYALSGRSALRGRKLYFILATAYPSLDVAVGAIRAAVVDLLEKPFPPAALNASLLRIRAIRAEAKAAEPLVTQLTALSDEMQRIGSLLSGPADANALAPGDSLASQKEVDANLVRRLVRAEYSRSRVIGGKILGDPAWNILLDLLLASLEGRRVAVSSACIVAGVATTTALRLVNRMVDDGVLVRIPDDNDGRRSFLGIEPTVEKALKCYLLDLATL